MRATEPTAPRAADPLRGRRAPRRRSPWTSGAIAPPAARRAWLARRSRNRDPGQHDQLSQVATAGGAPPFSLADDLGCHVARPGHQTPILGRDHGRRAADQLSDSRPPTPEYHENSFRNVCRGRLPGRDFRPGPHRRRRNVGFFQGLQPVRPDAVGGRGLQGRDVCLRQRRLGAGPAGRWPRCSPIWPRTGRSC